jgi:hypothetical protein
MAIPINTLTWGSLFYPVTVYGNSGGENGDRQYAVTDPTQYFVFETTREMTLANPIYFQYPRTEVFIESVDPETGSGTGILRLTFFEERTAAYLVGKGVDFDDGSSTTITADAATPAGQTFDFAGPDLPSYVTAIGGMEAV